MLSVNILYTSQKYTLCISLKYTSNYTQINPNPAPELNLPITEQSSVCVILTLNAF